MWWRRLTGGKSRPEQADSRPRRPARRAVGDGEGDGEGLRLEDAPPRRKHARAGGAGFDPYSSDAGYTKPHSWERVDHD